MELMSTLRRLVPFSTQLGVRRLNSDGKRSVLPMSSATL